MSIAIGWEQLAVAAHQKTKERDYWQARLAGEFVRGEFPGDAFAGASVEWTELAELPFECPAPLSQALLKLSNNSDARLLMVLASGVLAVLYKYTGHRDLVIGTTIPRQETEGEYLNTVLPLRSAFPSGGSFKDLLIEMRRTLTEAVDYQSYPMAILAEKLGLAAAGGNSPFFDTAVVLENMQEMSYLEGARPGLVFSFRRTETGVKGSLRYNAERYEAETAARFASHLMQLLQGATANPDGALDEMDVIGEAERQQLLVDFNPQAELEMPTDRTLAELFEVQAERTPDAVAVVHQDASLTYRELNEQANRLARILIEKGAGANRIVALMAERSERMLVCILAVLKAGAAYLPLDPDFPAERIGYMLEDSEAVLLLGDPSLTADWAAQCPTLDPAAALATGGTADNLPRRNAPSDLAYVIYTSGSTGKPKGVMVEHRNVAALVTSLEERVYRHHAPGLRVATVAPFVFDATVQMLFPALLFGHALYVVPNDVRADGGRLVSFYREHAIDLTDGTPSHLRLMLESLGDRPLEGLALQRLLVGGEALPRDVASAFLHKFPGNAPILTNSYGPSECCVQSSAFDLLRDDLDRWSQIPIGNPLPGESIYILDSAARLLPIGVPGELCIGGPGVTRGYLKRDDLTAAQFIDNPYRPGERLYRTGDLARYRADGNIEYLGRIDQQVKIRGYRIELQEIEHELRNHADACGFTDAVVIDRAYESGERYLCAYIVSEREIDAGDLKSRLSMTLPPYMVPPFLVRIDKLPMNVSGKLDRKALPDPRNLLAAATDYVAPRNEIESRLAVIWSEILEISADKIGVYDTFFDLGGTSFKVLQLSNKLQEEFLREVPVVQLFRFTTIHALGEFLGQEPDATDLARGLDETEQLADEALDFMEDNLQMFEVGDDD